MIRNGLLMKGSVSGQEIPPIIIEPFEVLSETSWSDTWVSYTCLELYPELLQSDENGWCVVPSAVRCKLTPSFQQSHNIQCETGLFP